jgi:hypothetical protein
MVIDTDSRNGKLLESFVGYCITHPNERFWQALRNWANVGYILASGISPVNMQDADAVVPGVVKDTFNWEGRNG